MNQFRFLFIRSSAIAIVAVLFSFLIVSAASAAAISDSTYFAEFSGESGSDRAGVSVASAGDVNGDGYDDVLIGATGDDDAASGAGAAYLIYGSSTTLSSVALSDSSVVKFTGESGSDNAGVSVASAGDVNGDGYDDIVIGANQNTGGGSGAGAVYLIYGQSAALTSVSLGDASVVKFTGQASDKLGFSVASAGDIDGDGYDDILMGAPENDDVTSLGGAVYIAYGQESALTSVAVTDASITQITSESMPSQAGYSVASAGDADGDGYDDILIGAITQSDAGITAGAAYMVYGLDGGISDMALGDAAAIQFTAEANDDATGSAVGAGDFDNDGYSDIVIGSPGHDSATGAVHILYGSETDHTNRALTDASFVQLDGDATTVQLGDAISSGDINGDGYDDLLLGAPRDNDGVADGGAAYVVYGESDDLTSGDVDTLGATQFTGAESVGELGKNFLSAAGDVNGDGYTDLIIGESGSNDVATDAGAAYVVYIDSAAPVITVSGDTTPSVECTASYVDAGATKSDNLDTSITGAASSTGSVDVDTPGDYVLTYTAVTDASGNTSTAPTRTVTVEDTVQPSVDLTGSSSLSIEEGATYTESGATATDDCDSDIAVVITGSVDTDTPGVYTLTYTATDDSGNSNATTRTVTVTEGEAELSYEIGGDGIDNDGDGTIDEVNTGTHPTYGSMDANDADVHDSAITSVTSQSAGKIHVTYVDGSVFEYDVFSKFSKTKESKVLQWRSKSYYVVLHPHAKNVKLVNALNGQVVDTQKLGKHKWKLNSIKILDVRTDGSKQLVITSKNNTSKGKTNRVRVVVLNVKPANENIVKKDAITFNAKKAKVGKTTVKGNRVRVRKKNGKNVNTLLRATKKLNLRVVE